MTILFQHLSSINVFFAEATGGGDCVDCSRLLTNLFPYDYGTSLPNKSFVVFPTMEDNDEDERVEGEMFNSKAGPSQLDCTYEALDDEPSRPYLWCQNISGLKLSPPQTVV